MRSLRAVVVASAVVIGGSASPLMVSAQQPAAAPAADLATEVAAKVRIELDKIKKGRTLRLFPAQGTDDSNGATILRLDNTSPFNLVVLIVGPTTERIELGPERMQSLPLPPGDYEIAFTVVGRDVPPFYGRQTITPNLMFRHKFVIPGV